MDEKKTVCHKCHNNGILYYMDSDSFGKFISANEQKHKYYLRSIENRAAVRISVLSREGGWGGGWVGRCKVPLLNSQAQLRAQLEVVVVLVNQFLILWTADSSQASSKHCAIATAEIIACYISCSCFLAFKMVLCKANFWSSFLATELSSTFETTAVLLSYHCRAQ